VTSDESWLEKELGYYIIESALYAVYQSKDAVKEMAWNDIHWSILIFHDLLLLVFSVNSLCSVNKPGATDWKKNRQLSQWNWSIDQIGVTGTIVYAISKAIVAVNTTQANGLESNDVNCSRRHFDIQLRWFISMLCKLPVLCKQAWYSRLELDSD
jgi:hypothetical protein